jgi:excisionase family DNA binding protein
VQPPATSDAAEPAALPEILTTLEAAAMLRCSRQYLEGARVHGDGPPFTRMGRLVRYRKTAILAWLAKHEVTSTSAGAPK